MQSQRRHDNKEAPYEDTAAAALQGYMEAGLHGVLHESVHAVAAPCRKVQYPYNILLVHCLCCLEEPYG